MRFDLASRLAPLTAALQRLSSRERSLLGGALAVIVVMGFYLLVWQPLEDSQIALAKRIQTKKAELDQMQRMRGEYLDLLSQFELRQKIIEKADPKFSLFPHIESTVAQVLGGRDKIASMNPQNKDLSGAYREESVELKLNGVSLQQLVDLMYHIEKGAQPLRLTRLSVKKRPRDPQSFDVTATVAMLKSTAGAHPPEHPPTEPVAPDVPEGVAPEGAPEGAPVEAAPGEPAPGAGAPAAEGAPAAAGAPPVAGEPPAEGAPPLGAAAPAPAAPAPAVQGRVPAPRGADRPPPAPPAGGGMQAPQAGAPPAAPPAEAPPPRPHASLDGDMPGLQQMGKRLMRLPSLSLPRLSFDWLEIAGGRRLLLYGLYTSVLFLVFLFANFPHHAVTQRILAALNLKGQGLQLDIADTRFAWWHGFELQRVRLAPLDPDRAAFVDASSLFIRPGFDGLLRGKISNVHLEGLMYGGQIDTDLALDNETRRATVTVDRVQLQRYPLLNEILQDGSMSGLLSGVMSVELHSGDNNDTRAAGEFDLEHVDIQNAKVNIFPIPALSFDKSNLKFSLQGGRLEIQEFQADGPELSVSLSGQIALRQPISDSVLNLKLSAAPGPNSPEEVKNLLALLPPPAKGAKPDAPHIISGTLARPRLR